MKKIPWRMVAVIKAYAKFVELLVEILFNHHLLVFRLKCQSFTDGINNSLTVDDLTLLTAGSHLKISRV